MANKIVDNNRQITFVFNNCELPTTKETFVDDLVWYLLKVLPALEHAKETIAKDIQNLIGDTEPSEALELCKAKGMLV